MCRLYYYSIRELSGHGRLFFYLIHCMGKVERQEWKTLTLATR